MQSGLSRTSLQLYRDCLRLIGHIAPGTSSLKSQSLRRTVRTSFEKNRGLSDPSQIEGAKAGAVRGLANYMMFEAASKEESGRLRSAVKDFTERERPKNIEDIRKEE